MNKWFDIDKDGFGQLMADRPKVAILYDLIQNILDEDATVATLTLEPIRGRRGRALLTVTDDVPNGFADLRDAYTLYRASRKKNDPTKRGRFNEGEKFVLSQCDEAEIVTTTGGVRFNKDGTRTSLRRTTDRGSTLTAVIRLTHDEVATMCTQVQAMIVPEGVSVLVNGTPLKGRNAIRTVEATLPTIVTDEDGNLTRTRRATTVHIDVLAEGETPYLYEMGIPIVEIDTPWHVDVQQKVPLNRDRDNVTPAYRRDLLAIVLDETVDLLTEDTAAESWVKDALPAAEADTVEKATTKMFGKGWVIGTPADREADKNAIAHGVTVVGGGALGKDAWEAVRASQSAKPSADKYSLGHRTDPRGFKPKMAEVTPFTTAVKKYALKVCKFLLDEDYFEIDLQDDSRLKHGGLYYGRRIVINLHSYKKIKDKDEFGQALDSLLIHECAHRYSGDHLTMEYIKACTKLGAKLRNLPTRWRAEVG